MTFKTVYRHFPDSFSASAPFLVHVRGDKCLIAINADAGIREEDALRFVFACIALGYVCSVDDSRFIPFDEAREKAIAALIAHRTAADLKAMLRKERSR